MAAATTPKYTVDVDATILFEHLKNINDKINAHRNVKDRNPNEYFPVIYGMSTCCYEMREALMNDIKSRRALMYKKSFGYAWRIIYYYLVDISSNYDREKTFTEKATDEQITKLEAAFKAIWIPTCSNATSEMVTKNDYCRDQAIYAAYMYMAEFKTIMHM